MKDKISLAVSRLNSAIEIYKPRAVFGLFSGGHDSFSSCYIASLASMFSGVVHINTGIGIEETRNFVRRTCSNRNWKLLEYNAKENTNAKGEPDPQDYEAIVLKAGFPGPFAHRFMYARLKQRQIQKLERDFSATRDCRILLVSGCRKEESDRRMGTTLEVQLEERRIWVAPIHDWTKLDTSRLLEHANQERNPIVDLIHKSGECLCGAFAKKGELEELKLWPQTRPTYDRIIELQKKVRAAGFPWGWEDAPPEWFQEKKTGQTFLMDYDTEEPQHLCWSCNIGKP